MSLIPGTRIGPYEVLTKVGEGGMGAVYRAHDSRLNREVAIKVLPPSLSRDEDRLRRFEQEARATSALNHPNIITVYDTGQHDGSPYIVAELLNGEELRRHVDAGPIPVRKALDYARQIVAGLSAAHEKGIVHRDLKPENIFITADDRVKILDFGLAKLAEVTEVGGGHGETRISAGHTSIGVVLGTPAYMSPEQIRGGASDHRSDIFSFGVILYEMLTGKKAFHGDSVVELMNAILKEDVPEFDEDSRIPPALDKIMRRCLDKRPAHRFHSAHDLGFALEALSAPTSSSSSSGRSTIVEPPTPVIEWPGTVQQRFWQATASAFAIVAIGLAIAGWLLWPSAETRSERSLSFSPLSFEQGGQCCVVWSPDGKAVAYAASQNRAEPAQVYVRYLDAPVARQLTGLPHDALPIQWTTTGKIIFAAAEFYTPALWSVSPVGGEPETFFEFPKLDVMAAAVSRDGTTVAAFRSDQDVVIRVFIGPSSGKELRRYDPSPFEAASLTNIPRLAFSPDGKQLLLIRNAAGGRGEEGWVLPVPANAASPPRRVLEGFRISNRTSGVSWMPDNRHVVLGASTADEPSHLFMADTVSGTVDALTNGTKPQAQPAVSPDGMMVALREDTSDHDIVSIDLATGAVKPVIATQRNEYHPMWSRQDAGMAYVTDRNGQREIWIHKPGQADRPLVTARDFPANTTMGFQGPSLSPDGSRVIYTRLERGAGRVKLWMSAVGGGAPVQLLASTDGRQELAGSWSPDGNWFVYWAYERGRHSLSKVKTTGMATPEVIVAGIDGTSWVPTWSPSGEWILYNGDGARQLRSPDGKESRKLLGDAWIAATFSNDGKTIYGVQYGKSGPELVSLNIASGALKVLHALEMKDIPSTPGSPTMKMSLMPDGKSITYTSFKGDGVLWLLSGLGAGR